MGLFSDILLTVDFDRTLTAPDSSIPQRNLEAIRYFIHNGGAFTVNTGRSIPMSRPRLIPEVPLSAPLLLYNGSAAYDPATGTLSQCLPIQLDPKTVIEDLQSRFPALTVEIQAVDAHYAFRKDPPWEAFSGNNGCAWGYADPSEIPGPFLKFALYSVKGDTVAQMYDATEEELALFREATEYIHNRYGEFVDTFRACPRILDVQAKGVSKLRAARQLQQRLGRKYLVCVGDAENDLPMLEGADFAFCPSDGIIADRFPNVCPCGDGAVADVIYEKIPLILQNKP